MVKPILDVVHEIVQGLHTSGVIKNATLREFDTMCLPAIEEYSAAQIKRIRTKNHANQGVFTAYLNIRKSTIKNGRKGRKGRTAPR